MKCSKYVLVEKPEGFRIAAIKDFCGVKKGDIGGIVAGYHSLSQEGECWVDFTSEINDNAMVCGDVKIMNHSVISGNSFIKADACAIINSDVDDSIINNSGIYDSSIKYTTVVESHVYDSVLVNSAVGNCDIDECSLNDTQLVSEKVERRNYYNNKVPEE